MFPSFPTENNPILSKRQVFTEESLSFILLTNSSTSFFEFSCEIFSEIEIWEMSNPSFVFRFLLNKILLEGGKIVPVFSFKIEDIWMWTILMAVIWTIPFF